MIKTENEYKEAKKRLQEEFKKLKDHESKMKSAGLNSEHVKLAIDPLRTFALQLKEEVDEYEKLMRGQFDPLQNLHGLGRALVALRIHKGLTQTELAEKLGVSLPQVSRDERNEYHGASLEKIQKVLDALNVKLETKVDLDIKNVI